MKARNVIGKKIVAVNQERVFDARTKKWFFNVRSIQLDDGTRLIPLTVELDDDYGIEVLVAPA